jgi:hypothetical protein
MPYHLEALLILAVLTAAPAWADEEPDPCSGRNPLHCRNPDAETPEPEQPVAEDCEGKNPLYCGVPVTSHGEGEVALMPPGGCEGRNPAYCRERAPKVEEEPEGKPARKRASSNSANPHRNPKANPRANPNRRPRGSGG